MKLLTFFEDQTYKLGVHSGEGEGILDIAAALGNVSGTDVEDGVPVTLQAVIEGGANAMDKLRTFVEIALRADNRFAYIRPESTLTLGPCVTHPNKMICVGLNYRKHAEETGAEIPTYPVLFNKFSNTLASQGDEIPLPKVSSEVDYEAELVIVIGKQAKNVAKEDALSYVLGYCNVNDLSARDLQFRTSQWLTGKSCDKFSPLGPYLVTADEVGDPNQLEIKCIVNGEVRQASNTSDMIFYCDEIVSYISQLMTLVPGDVILTGTPEGVVLGKPVDERVYLQPGDVVTIEIEKLGSLTNTMVAEIEQ
ncbi:5-carboxymethyl-2-hydroxymuconate isomerase [Paenibacillus sp. MY03]|uniref:fumarylacetoacetate hydrolase family protein n=1 Tax=Paenibacillus sp. MY03 TaxID=302980 RepID=UPI000B3D2981|nr:fumarylacetoacetate hydrolase family protein [Paenibacillus sp. MY03]OUS78644.1 5-carboxymethyl-2-hydroxymuconate isomerase [Paenibacillus sp. MY03]